MDLEYIINGEIKFRGLCKDSYRHDEWIYGYPRQMFDELQIHEFDRRDVLGHRLGGADYKVYQGTICMSTRYKDKNEVEIYEGDIVKIEDNKTGVICYGAFEDNKYYVDCLGFYIRLDNGETYSILEDDAPKNKILKHLEIISNIHKNTLIEKQKCIEILEKKISELENEHKAEIALTIEEIKKLITELKS